MQEPNSPVRYCERRDELVPDQLVIDEVILDQMNHIKGWVSSDSTGRYMWSTCQAEAMRSVYDIVSMIEASGENAHAVANCFKNRMEYGLIGPRNRGFSMRQIELMTNPEDD